MLPEVENITEVEIMESTSKTSKIINTKEEISKLVSDIKDNQKILIKKVQMTNLRMLIAIS